MLDRMYLQGDFKEQASQRHEGTVTRKTADMTRKEAIDVASEYR